MRVVAVEQVSLDAPARLNRALNVELAGLVLVTIVVLAGTALTYSAKVARLQDAAPAGSVVPLYALKSAADLEPALGALEPERRRAVSRALFERAAAPLDRVGALAPILSRAEIALVKPRLAVRSVGQFTREFVRAVAILVATFWLAHLVRRWRRRDDDPLVLPALMLLCGIGVMTMCALRDPVRDTVTAALFAGGAALGVALLVAASEIDYEASALRRAVALPLGLALALATLLLLFGSGPGTSGVKVNLLGVQPVEAIRLLVVFALAAYFGRRLELLRELSEPATPARPWLRVVRVPRWQDVRPIVASMALVLLFFVFQKDLGPALVLSCVFLALFGVARGRAGLVTCGFAMLLAGFAVAYWTGVPATVRNRVMIWADPWNNGAPGGNHVAHGLWALATGGPWGSGPGLGTPNAIPEAHTDFVLAAVGEELGWIGFAVVVALYALLLWRCLRIAARAPGDFTSFLVIGIVLVLGVQALVIAGGLFGLIPLSGVVTPFLSYGRSSMLVNCVALGIVLSAARRRSTERAHLRRPLRVLGATMVIAATAIAGRAAWVQIVKADTLAAATSLSGQGDGGYRFEYNPRLLAAARSLERGTIYDRNRLPLATSRPAEIAALGAAYEHAAGVALDDCGDTDGRCYPLGGLAFHLVGDWTHQANWAARNSSYFERDSDARLKGYDDRAQLVDVVNPRTGRRGVALRRDLRELLPLVRQRYRPKSSAVVALRSRDRDLRTTIDARLQVRVAAALRDGIAAGRFARGAAVVLDAATGEVLAAASYPWPELADAAAHAGPVPADEDGTGIWLDRARYGLYPPGSTFKLLIAGAALRSPAADGPFVCKRLPDGRVGNYVSGQSRPVRDDLLDTVPHGHVDLDRGLVVSCNAYFAQLAQSVGAQAVLDTASLFQINVARTATPAGLRPTLAHVGYGQGEAVVTPLKLARISAAIAAGGAIAPVRWEPAAEGTPRETTRFLPRRDADRLARAMRGVVTTGTGRSLRAHQVPIAGKTGTAEIGGAPAHAWFTGFAPAGGAGRRLAFAVLIENAGYGGRAAAPVAGAIVSAASELGLIK